MARTSVAVGKRKRCCPKDQAPWRTSPTPPTPQNLITGSQTARLLEPDSQTATWATDQACCFKSPKVCVCVSNAITKRGRLGWGVGGFLNREEEPTPFPLCNFRATVSGRKGALLICSLGRFIKRNVSCQLNPSWSKEERAERHRYKG